MSLYLDRVGVEREPVSRTWRADDAILYALGVGAGLGAPDTELEFSTETGIGPDQKVLPTFVSVLVPGRIHGLGDFPLTSVVHGEESITLHGPLPVDGEVSIATRISAMRDKGRAALIEVSADIYDESTRRLLASVNSGLFVRGEGGFGGDRGAPVRPTPPAPPDRPADASRTMPTRPEQALLYRLNGDRNPLHADPASARVSGFDQPILHGLCTWGITGRAAVAELCGGDPAALGSMSGRFSNTVIPGDELTVRFWDLGDGAFAFRTYASGNVAIDRGFITLAKEHS